MTTFLYHENKYYADSIFVKGMEKFQSLTKIIRLEDPLAIKSEVDKFVFDDVIYGWFGTGTYRCMKRFIDGLHITKLESHIAMVPYELAIHAGLVNDNNCFEIILIGKKLHHHFCFYASDFTYEYHAKDHSFGMGGGGTVAMGFLHTSNDPIRAMLETFFIDENSGGNIDIWQFSDGKFPSFRRIGMCEEVSKSIIPIHLAQFNILKGEKVPVDFIHRRVALSETIALLDTRLKAKNAKELAAKKVPIKKVAAKKTPRKS